MLLGEDRVALRGVETFPVPLRQVGRLEDRHIDVTLHEQVIHHHLGVVLLELLVGPMALGRPEPVVGVEAVDEPLGVDLLALDPVVRRSVPMMDVPVHDVIPLTVALIHLRSLLPHHAPRRQVPAAPRLIGAPALGITLRLTLRPVKTPGTGTSSWRTSSVRCWGASQGAVGRWGVRCWWLAESLAHFSPAFDPLQEVSMSGFAPVPCRRISRPSSSRPRRGCRRGDGRRVDRR